MEQGKILTHLKGLVHILAKDARSESKQYRICRQAELVAAGSWRLGRKQAFMKSARRVKDVCWMIEGE